MTKKIFVLIIFLFIVFSVKSFGKSDNSFSSGDKSISIIENGLLFEVKTSAFTVGDLFEEQGIYYKESDQVIPGWDDSLYPQSRVILQRSKEISVYVDGGKIEGHTLEKSVGGVLEDLAINIQEEDIIDPRRSAFAHDGMEIKITRVEIKEEKISTPIDFEVEVSQDSSLGWREEKVIQGGKKGEKETTYNIVYHNGKEISRKQLGSEIKEHPQTKIVKKGTSVKVGAAKNGLGTWYAQPGHLKNNYPSITGYYAASTTVPKGSYVKVTARNSGKSLIARINDYGPFGENRIIDLDSVAFSQLAPLGAGVIDVKVERVLN